MEDGLKEILGRTIGELSILLEALVDSVIVNLRSDLVAFLICPLTHHKRLARQAELSAPASAHVANKITYVVGNDSVRTESVELILRVQAVDGVRHELDAKLIGSLDHRSVHKAFIARIRWV